MNTLHRELPRVDRPFDGKQPRDQHEKLPEPENRLYQE
jgi:hypothetical protein